MSVKTTSTGIDFDTANVPSAPMIVSWIEQIREEHVFASTVTSRGGINTRHAGCIGCKGVEFDWNNRETEFFKHLDWVIAQTFSDVVEEIDGQAFDCGVTAESYAQAVLR